MYPFLYLDCISIVFLIKSVFLITKSRRYHYQNDNEKKHIYQAKILRLNTIHFIICNESYSLAIVCDLGKIIEIYQLE